MRWLDRSAIDFMRKHKKFVEKQQKKMKLNKNVNNFLLWVFSYKLKIYKARKFWLHFFTPVLQNNTKKNHRKKNIILDSFPMQALLIMRATALPSLRPFRFAPFFCFWLFSCNSVFYFFPLLLSKSAARAQPVWRILVAPWMTTLLRSRLLLKYPTSGYAVPDNFIELSVFLISLYLNFISSWIAAIKDFAFMLESMQRFCAISSPADQAKKWVCISQ